MYGFSYRSLVLKHATAVLGASKLPTKSLEMNCLKIDILKFFPSKRTHRWVGSAGQQVGYVDLPTLLS
jgi:hypothetical protein